MTRLPHKIDFDERTFPELAEVFLSIDLGIAAIVASDPAMRPRLAQKRRMRRGKAETTGPRGGASRRKAA